MRKIRLPLILRLRQKTDTRYIPAGWIVARDQFVVNEYAKLALNKKSPATVTQKHHQPYFQ